MQGAVPLPPAATVEDGATTAEEGVDIDTELDSEAARLLDCQIDDGARERMTTMELDMATGMALLVALADDTRMEEGINGAATEELGSAGMTELLHRKTDEGTKLLVAGREDACGTTEDHPAEARTATELLAPPIGAKRDEERVEVLPLTAEEHSPYLD
jgi:hypothetical protein